MAREDEILDAVVALDAPPGTTVELELGEVGYVDSRGLAAILNVKTHLDARGSPLRLVRPQQQYRRLVHLIGVSDVVIFDA